GSGARCHAPVRQRRPLGLARGLSNDPSDETQTAADSCAADFEDISSRSYSTPAAALALADDVSEKALLIESLAHVAQGAVLGATPALDTEDRWGSHARYDMIRCVLA
ncbi:unnamed protein product, partial [Ectocarpus sp. 12 AP-2014]